MKVSTSKPFQIIYSLYQHEYLGYLFESFAIQVNELGKLTLLHQNISAKNAKEFAKGLDERDYQLISIMDEIQQDAVVRKFSKKPIKPADFFLKTYGKEKNNELLQEQIENYLEIRRSSILELLNGKEVYEMGNDGEPAWKRLTVEEEKASVLFHFRRNDDNTHYFPTIKFGGQKIEFQYKGAFILCNDPAWMALDGQVFTFEKEVDGHKLQPFLNKKFIVIPKSVEEDYYSKFVAPLIESFDVYARGFEIDTITEVLKPQLILSVLKNLTQNVLFGEKGEEGNDERVVLELQFRYGIFTFKADKTGEVNVKMEPSGESYVFHRINRNIRKEKHLQALLKEKGLVFHHGKALLSKTVAFDWLNENKELLQNEGINVSQTQSDGKRYFLGQPSISMQINEAIDWFDIKAIILFGEFEIPFNSLRKYILKKQTEFTLPNGEIAVIPESWLTEYSDLIFMSEDSDDPNSGRLKKHHVSLVREMEKGKLATLQISDKLEKLRDFDEIDDYDMPQHFEGTLRPYQKAGYNWMRFLNEFKFGACLADDMGLGKTVQALALLEAKKEKHPEATSLLVLPTSLVYNWQKEAEKFTPSLKVFCYTGTNRDKDSSKFSNYDLIITTYGIVRLDVDLLQQFYFEYVILDESQPIKNPNSFISKAVRELKSSNKLILTGTPLENSTMDIWSQLDFINPGLLGNKNFFRNEFLLPIEKKGDAKKTARLNAMLKPFILRRHKSQVATELPEKVENLYYSSMSESQEEIYNEVKNAYRNEILNVLDTKWLKSNQITVLQGLTKLRQLANHPVMIDPTYTGDSGKMNDVLEMIETTIANGHKILIFSQFVKHLKLFSDHLMKNGYPFAYLDGSTRDRMGQVNKFQNDPNINLFLISLKAGGLGLNLTKADYVFLLDPWWNPAVEAQAIDRTHRIGQINQVFAYKFVTKDSVEEKIIALQNRKIKLSQDLITAEKSFMKSLTADDIAAILK